MMRNGIFGRPGTSAKEAMTTPATSGALRWLRDLLDDVGAEVVLGGRARDDDAGRDRDEQRGDLRDEAVADAQQREVLDRLAESGRPCWTTPMTMPPMRLIAVMRTAAIASPLTNFEAPSIAP